MHILCDFLMIAKHYYNYISYYIISRKNVNRNKVIGGNQQKK
jgi:hypothetical protein